ncbi:MAG TPA: hypothetical protein VEY33_11965 [Gemmatimonadota bacterium]|nr:hypothetical protein [Gemmatimonadota bacterium]
MGSIRASIAACALLVVGLLWEATALGQGLMGHEASAVPPTTILGFADINYVETERKVDEGFVLGQLAGHITSGLTERLTFFGEVSATARPDEYRIEVERLILRYDFNDQVKLSGGRYHNPVSYWNTAFHHGLWLQTSVSRPEMIKFGGRVLPVHFVGLQVEGGFPLSPLGFGYAAGVGNGRGDAIARGGDSGDTNQNRALLATVRSRPARIFGLQLGGALYVDKATAEGGFDVDEQIYSAHLALTRERPEILAEYARIRHEPDGGGETTDTDAWYLQAAYRLPLPIDQFKPYARVERITVDDDDPLFAPFGLDYKGFLAGVRYDFASLAAIKIEYRDERFADDEEREKSLWAQVSFTFGEH